MGVSEHDDKYAKKVNLNEGKYGHPKVGYEPKSKRYEDVYKVDGNIQRETTLPSEKAFAYKMKMDAIHRQAGRPTQNNSRQVGENLYSVEQLTAGYSMMTPSTTGRCGS